MSRMASIAMALVTALALPASPVIAQQEPDDWTFRVTPYLVGTGMNGDVAIHGRATALDASFGDILENLEFGAMLNFVAMSGPWSCTVDLIYMGLGSTTDRPPAEIDLDQWLVEVDGAYQFNSWVAALAGVRFNSLSGDILFQGERERESAGTRNWFDPVIGTRLTGQVADRWTLRGRADIGGFGIGSRLTWQLAAYIDFRASDLVAVVGGYRWLYNDYEAGSGGDEFRYDMTVSGPALGVTFVF